MSLLVVSLFATILCLGISLLCWGELAVTPLHSYLLWLRLLPLGLVIGCALCTIRGYALTANALLIHRLFWSTRLPLAGLQSVQFQPEVMRGSIRTFGNGGFFSFTGRYWNKQLGTYRAFVTDPKRAVVLKFPGRTIVVSPDPPEEFVRELSAHTSNR